MMPLMKTTEALVSNNKDGFCFNVLREGSDPFNFCFDNKRLRDIIMMTVYNNYMLYKMQENGYLLNAAALNCDDVKAYQMLKNAYEIAVLKSSYPADYGEFIDQSRKFILKYYELTYSPPAIEGETPEVLKIEDLYQNCESGLSSFKSPYQLSFLQKDQRVKKMSFVHVRNRSHVREEKAEEAKENNEEETEEHKKWKNQLKKMVLKEYVPSPDIRIPTFDKSSCKEGEDTFMCMTDFLSKHYNRIKCDKRLRKDYYAK